MWGFLIHYNNEDADDANWWLEMQLWKVASPATGPQYGLSISLYLDGASQFG